MFVPLTGRERDTLAYLQETSRESLPDISYSVKGVFAQYAEAAKDMPTLQLKASLFHISPVTIKQLEDKIDYPSRKHKILSVLAMAALVTVAVAVIASLALFAPAYLGILVIVVPLIAAGIGGLGAYIHQAFLADKQDLKHYTETSRQLQINIDNFKVFMDKHGTALKETAVSSLTEWKRAEEFYAALELRPGQRG